jgi:hypothetical protein
MDEERVNAPVSVMQLIWAAFALIMVVIIGAVCLVSLYLQPALHEIDQNGQIAACNTATNGRVWQAIAVSLGAPPAPSAARTESVLAIRREADRFDDCKH